MFSQRETCIVHRAIDLTAQLPIDQCGYSQFAWFPVFFNVTSDEIQCDSRIDDSLYQQYLSLMHI